MKLHLPVLALAAASSPLVAQTLVLPDNHNFMESANYTTNVADTTYWTTTTRHFQILYEASHFTGKAGIQPGGVLITRIQFRGEDGETNIGGQVYSNVTVELGSTSLDSTTMTTTFANNRAAGTTTMGPLGTVPSLTVGPSAGSCPNSYIIDIDLLAIGAQFLFDPHGPQPNLLIDITIPTAPTQVPPQAMIGIQDTVAHGAGIRGRAIQTSNLASATGTSDTTPPVVGIEFAGPGGLPTTMPARAEFVGAGCGGAHSTIYQGFSQDQTFDLGAGLTFLPDVYPSPNLYAVVLGAPPIDLTQLQAVADTSALDSSVVHTLGFTTPFQYPGGSTTSIRACTLGYVWLDSTAMTDAGQFDPTRAEMLGGTTTPFTARFMPYWSDEHAGRNLSLNPQAGLHVTTVPESAPGAGDAVCYVTWNDMGVWRAPNAGQASNTFQAVFHELTGIVEFRYGTMMPHFSSYWTSTAEYAAIIGFTRGRIGGVNSLDPQSRDLSHELPYATSIEGTTSNVSLTGFATPIAGTLTQTARMFGGQTMTWNISNIPVGTIIAWTLLDVGIQKPSFPLGAFGFAPPGCGLSVSANPVMMPFEQFVLPGSTATGVATLVVPHGWEGTTISAQAIGVDVFGGPYLIPWTSNAIEYTVGLD